MFLSTLMKNNCRKILLISETDINTKKLYLDPVPKLMKGFIRLGHEARHLSYTGIMAQLSPFKGRSLKKRFHKVKTDEVLCEYSKHFMPDIVYFGFARGLDKKTVQRLRDVAPNAVFVGWDQDPWPENKVGRLELGCEMDVLLGTNNGSFLEEYRSRGARKCIYMPNLVDPDTDRRHHIDDKWKGDVLWTGKIQHQPGIDAGETVRQDAVRLLADRPGAKIYGCLGRPQIGGVDYLHAIIGARIGISINAINSIPLYHSDRFTQYSACGTLVLAKRVPDTESLMRDNEHVRYFDSAEECVDLVDWYLVHDRERKKIADAGMEYCHSTYNSSRIAGYILDVIDNGSYEAPWGSFS